jgi:hypothetical protein
VTPLVAAAEASRFDPGMTDAAESRAGGGRLRAWATGVPSSPEGVSARRAAPVTPIDFATHRVSNREV